MRDPGQVAVVGVSGYSGLELAQLLFHHPAAKSLVFYARDTQGAKCLSELFPKLRGRGKAPLLPLSEISATSAGTAFLATPHEASATLAPALLGAGLRVIDLSGAFRFDDEETFSEWYKLPTPHKAYFGQAVYGLPEIYPLAGEDPLAKAELVANPGCYATSVILALRPLAAAGWIFPGSPVVADCKSGASGAGKEPRKDLHFVELDGNFKAYNLYAHRHTPEILDHTGLLEEQLTFTTHLLPIARGILSTVYVTLSEKRSPEEIEALFRKYYAGRPMVRIHSAGSLPELQHVTYTNFCDLGFALDKNGRRLIIVSCLDNLGKGAAGQAIQNWNHMLGIEEQTAIQ
jgi:N-acetyl-gamma-glutamyl-phosphate reductase